MGLEYFDSWASTFGETATSVELSPEGTGYRAKTRFAKFFNLPELMNVFRETADIRTADMLDLDTPQVEYETVVTKPTQIQKDIVAEFAVRAERIRNGSVDSSIDNMLKVTNDGRNLALDQRIMNPAFPDNPESKVAVCAEKSYQIWKDTMDKRLTQLIFSDLSTPKGDGSFNVYDDLREKLKQKGVPGEEIVYIHEANTEKQKADLFRKVRSGQVRFLIGSTAKMGAGTNVQDLLIAEHHLDVPWRPSDIEQRKGRIIRQGNQNKKVKIFRYVTENTFDSYSWQTIENKQKFISQIMTSKSAVRSCDDIDEVALSYAEVKALATGNIHIKEKMTLDMEVSRLRVLKGQYLNQKYRLENDIAKRYPMKINALKEAIEGMEKDVAHYRQAVPEQKEDAPEKDFHMRVLETDYTDVTEAGKAISDALWKIEKYNDIMQIGDYLGFQMYAQMAAFADIDGQPIYELTLQKNMSYKKEFKLTSTGNVRKINDLLEKIPDMLEKKKRELEEAAAQYEKAKEEVVVPFSKEEELRTKLERLSELDALLNMDQRAKRDQQEIQVQPAENMAAIQFCAKGNCRGR